MQKTFAFAKAMLGTKVAELRTEKKVRIDKNLPLGITIGGLLEVDTVFHILMEEEFPFLKVDIPKAPLTVVAYGKTEDHGFNIHRFYLAEQSSDDPRWYLQVITRRDKVVEQNLWSVEDKIYPESLEEWAVWDDVSDTPGIMNVQVFVDNVHDSLEYTRHSAWGDGPYVRPRKLTEIVYLDEFGTEVVTLRHQSMLFGRNSAKYEIEETEVPDDAPVEWCLITIVSDSGGKSVEIRKGLDIDAGSLTVV